jgi:hypothetical protein
MEEEFMLRPLKNKPKWPFCIPEFFENLLFKKLTYCIISLFAAESRWQNPDLLGS